MTCDTCGFENAASAKFCAECGSRLSAVCPTCGSPIAPNAKFCAECGTSLVAGAGGRAAPRVADGPVPVPGAPARAEAPAAERRLVSVLFADLVGFTTLSEDRDPEAVRELLTRYFDTARDVVERYGGTIEKFIGDAVMAVWGTPVAHEDDAERAVRAALELVHAVGGLAASLGTGGASGVALAVRVGVTSGETAVTLGATGQGMVAGDVVNTASRLQSVAPANTVLVDERSERAARGAIAFEDAGEHVLKGKLLGVRAWHALRVVAGRAGAGRAGQLEAPFVGRDDEFRLLKDLLHSTSREGRARLVSVMGQAGIGKSRLAWEFEKYVDGVVETVYWHRGRSLAYGQGISFWALGEMVRERAGIAEGENDEASREKLVAALAEYVPDEAEQRWMEPHLASLLGLQNAPAGQREQAFAAWRTFFERISGLGTTVLVFEDLQWADAGLLDFIDHLLEWSRQHPILVVTLARHELLDRRPDWGAGRRNFVAIGLEPLAPAAMRALLEGLVPGLPEAAIAAILARAEGIPLYAVETVRMLLDEGRIEESDGAYRPTGALHDLAVPATLHALIASRLDGLSADDRALIHAAAVLGQTFTIDALAAVTEQPPEPVEARLRALVQRELLTIDVDPRSPERGQYGFTQGVIRDVAYGTLAKRERRARHLAAARYFEALGDDGLAGVLASHYVAAYRAAPEGPEGDATAVQARLALRGAADRAAAVHDYVGAAALLEQSREVTTDATEEAAIEERKAELLRLAGSFEAGETAIRRAIAHYESIGDPLAAARASTTLGLILIEAWRPAEAIPLLERALSVLDLDAPDATLAAVVAALARASISAGLVDKALHWVERALSIAERAGAPRPIVDALITRGWVMASLGRPYENTALLIGAAELARRHELPQEELRALFNLSSGAEEDPDRLALLYAEMRAVATRYGLSGAMEASNQAEMWFRLFTGEWDAALELALATEESGATTQTLVQRNGIVGFVAAARGDFDEAHRMVAANGRLFEGITKANDRATHDLEIAGLALAERRLEDAFSAGMSATSNPETGPWGAQFAAHAAFWLTDRPRADEAMTAFETSAPPVIGGRGVRAEITGLRAALAGDVATARTQLRQAAEVFRSIRQPFPTAWIDVARVRVLGVGDPEGRAAADEAREILDQLRARAFLEWLEIAIRDSTAAAPARAATDQSAAAVSPRGV